MLYITFHDLLWKFMPFDHLHPFLPPLLPPLVPTNLVSVSMSSGFCLFVCLFLDSTYVRSYGICLFLSDLFFTYHNALKVHSCYKQQDFILFMTE